MADDLEEIWTRLQTCFEENNSNDLKWSDTRDIFKCLKIKVKDPNNRAKVSSSHIDKAKQILLSCKRQLTAKVLVVDETLACCLMTATEAFRFLRNTAAGVSQNQESIMLAGIVEQVKEITSHLLKPQYQESTRSDIVNDAVKSGIQVLGNMVVSNDLTQDYVWRQCFDDFFLLVLTSANLEIQNCMCMVIYNCMSSKRSHDLVSSIQAYKIMSRILHLCADHEDLEWGYFIIDTLVMNGHVADLYKGLEFDPSARIILLDLIQVQLTGSKCNNQKPLPTEQSSIKTSSSVPKDSLTFLAGEFEEMSNNVFKGDHDFLSPDNMMKTVLLSRLLRVLSAATALHLSVLQNHPQLLNTALDLLHQTNGLANRDKVSHVTSVSQSQDSGVLNPSHGFKRDLVRLIGNMCYQHTTNQDEVREKEGIPLLLDHCNIDDHNPYICQWAVFALRNVLQDNYKNQQIVASLDKRGLAENSRLRNFGIDVKQSDDGKVKLVRKKKD